MTPGEKLAMHKKDSSSYDGQRNDQDRSHPYPLFVIILFQILVHKKKTAATMGRETTKV